MGQGRRQPRARQRIVYHSDINETEHDSKEAALAEEGRKGYSEPVAVSLREGGDKDVSRAGLVAVIKSSRAALVLERSLPQLSCYIRL